MTFRVVMNGMKFRYVAVICIWFYTNSQCFILAIAESRTYCEDERLLPSYCPSRPSSSSKLHEKTAEGNEICEADILPPCVTPSRTKSPTTTTLKPSLKPETTVRTTVEPTAAVDENEICEEDRSRCDMSQVWLTSKTTLDIALLQKRARRPSYKKKPPKSKDISQRRKKPTKASDISQSEEKLVDASDISPSQEKLVEASDISQSQEKLEEPSDISQSQEKLEEPSDISQPQEKLEEPSEISQPQEKLAKANDISPLRDKLTKASDISESYEKPAQGNDITQLHDIFKHAPILNPPSHTRYQNQDTADNDGEKRRWRSNGVKYGQPGKFIQASTLEEDNLTKFRRILSEIWDAQEKIQRMTQRHHVGDLQFAQAQRGRRLSRSYFQNPDYHFEKGHYLNSKKARMEWDYFRPM